MFNSELWRAYFREISRDGPILFPKTIRQQPIRDSHSIDMDYRLALKGKLTLLLIDGAKRGDKNFYVIVAYSTQKLYFIDLLNLEASNHVTVAQYAAPII
jgi:hypothetical protein